MDITGFMRAVPLFSALDAAELGRAGELARLQTCAAGMRLFAKGNPSDCFYVVVQGAVEVRGPALPPGIERTVTLGSGKYFGEMGMLSGRPRSGNALVLEDSVLIRFDRGDFDQLMAVDLEIAEKVMASYMGRLAEIERSLVAARDAARDAGLLLFFSSGAGAGASFLCANLALKIHDLTRKSVLVLDLDVEAPTQHLYLGATQPGGLPQLLANGDFSPASIRESACKLHFGVDLLGGPGVPPTGSPSPAQGEDLVREACKAYDYVLIDTTSALTPLNLALFPRVGFVHVVVSPDIVSVSRCLALVRRLEEVGGSERIRLVLNKFQGGEGFSAETLEKKFLREVMGGVEYQHGLAVEAANDGVPVVRRSPRSTLTVDLARLARQVVSWPSLQPIKERSFSLWDLFG